MVKNGRKNGRCYSGFFPKREADMLEWFKNFSVVAAVKSSVWNVSAALAQDLTARVNAYEAAKGENGTKAFILEKNERQDALKADV
jgi:hypothetical protein